MDWFLYDRDLYRERVNRQEESIILKQQGIDSFKISCMNHEDCRKTSQNSIKITFDGVFLKKVAGCRISQLISYKD